MRESEILFVSRKGLIASLMGVVIALWAIMGYLIITSDPQQLGFEEQSDTLSSRITQVQAALDDLESLTSEIDSLAVEAVELEQKANDAIAISTLTEEQVKALEQRLNRDNTGREIAFLFAGAILGVFFDRLFHYLTRKWSLTTPYNTPSSPT